MYKKNKKTSKQKNINSPTNILFHSRIENFRQENINNLYKMPDLKVKVIKALLISDAPQLLQQIFDLELNDILNSFPNDIIVEIASLAMQNNATNSIKFLINLYGELLSSNQKFISCIAAFVDNKEMFNILVKENKFLSNDGKNLLHLALDIDNVKLINILSELDSSMIAHADQKGLTPLQYAIGYLHKDFEQENIFLISEKETALKRLKSKNDDRFKIIEKLITKSPKKILNNNSIYKFILTEFENVGQIDFPESKKFYLLKEETKKSVEILTIYWRGLYNKGYSKKDWSIIQDKIAEIIITPHLEKDIDLLELMFELFSVAAEELTIDNLMKCCARSKNLNLVLTPQTKLFILSKFAWYNESNGYKNLALVQASEAIEISKIFIGEDLHLFEWYKDAMYKIYLTYAHTKQLTNKNYGNIKILEALEIAENYAPTKNSFYYNIDKFIWYINTKNFNNPKLLELVKNIENIEVRTVLETVRKAMILPADLLSIQIDELIDKITAPDKRTLCQNLITQLRKDYQEEMGQYHNALNHYIETKDIISIARVCYKSKEPQIIQNAIKAINDFSEFFKQVTRYELFQISKSLIYLSVQNFNLASQALLSIKTIEIETLESHWKKLYCDLLVDLFFQNNCNIKDYIIKLEALNPEHKMLEVMKMYTLDSPRKVKVESQVSSVPMEDQAVTLLSKSQVLKLSEQEFLKECRLGKISHGLQKAYYKQLNQSQFQKEFASSIEECLYNNKIKIESWVLPSNRVILSNDPQVYQINNNMWATIDQHTIKSLDVSQRIAFENAITKGFANKGDAANGIKIIGNLAELKINADLRLYTKIKYINNHNASMIIFNQCGNHNKIRNEQSNDKMEEFFVNSYDDNTTLLDSLLNPMEYKYDSVQFLGDEGFVDNF